MRMQLGHFLSLMVVLGLHVSAGAAAEIDALITQIKAVGKEGQGNVEAAKAWRELVKEGPAVVTQLLAGLDDASPIAANWLRSAVDAIADKAHAAGKLPAGPLEAFVKDTRHSGAGRRLAFEWLVKVEPSARGRLLSTMLNDPGAELRREAVEVQLKHAQAIFEKDDRAASLSAFRKLLEFARDRDQVKLIAERLEKLGASIDLTTQFGFITRWSLVGPFDNTQGVGFRNAAPPEKGVDLLAQYTGKDGKPIRWIHHTAESPKTVGELKNLGMVDLNKLFQATKGDTSERIREAVVIGFTAFQSKTAGPVEIRAGSNNAIRIWLNGKEIYFREEYHHGNDMDQHVGKGTLKAGLNSIMIKVCQNNQDESWARQWSFQLRLCDAIGSAVPLTVVTER